MTGLLNNKVCQTNRAERCCLPGTDFRRRGVALLVVLFIVMTITVLSLGFLAGSDVELACGQNMVTVTQLGYLAESGVEHAKGLIVSPHDIEMSDSNPVYSMEGQQLAAGNDYYDVTVARDNSDPTDRCNYIIDCEAYRIVNGEQMGLWGVRANLRLDPCIALWTGASSRFRSGVTVYGDVYCGGNMVNVGSIDGDVFAAGSYDGNVVQGAVAEFTTEIPVARPNIAVDDFVFAAGVTYYAGGTPIEGNVNIEGMLLVDGDLIVRGANNTIVAGVTGKNLPALYVAGDLIVERGGDLAIEGLAVIDGSVLVNGDASVSITGGLFTGGSLLETVEDSAGSGYSGILYNEPIRQPSGGVFGGGALQFDGIDDYAQTDDSDGKLQLTSDYTLSVWVKASAIQNDWAGVLCKCDSGGTTNHWTVQFDNGSPKRLVVSHPSGSWDPNIPLDRLSGLWHHVGVVRDGGQMTAYLDGAVRKSESWAIGPGSGAGHLNFGVNRTTPGGSNYAGLIDDVRIYGRALSEAEINTVKAGVAVSGLIGHWRLDEDGADIVVTAAPFKTAVRVWYGGEIKEQWQQVGGAFFRSMDRKQE